MQAPGLPPAPAPRRKGRPSPLKGVARAPAQRASVASKGRGVHATGAFYAQCCSFDWSEGVGFKISFEIKMIDFESS